MLVSLSAYLRLAHSGIGCDDWPECYGRIGVPEQTAADDGTPAATGEAYRRLLERSGDSMAWATPLHRLVASVLGLVIVALNAFAWLRRRHRLNALALLALTVWLAVLGIRSGSLHDPAVVMGNLAGGFAMLGLLGWLWFRLKAPAAAGKAPVPAALAAIALAVLCAQIALGGFTSANFAATACRTLPDCHGGWWPGPGLATALDLSRHHEVTPTGQAIGGVERIAVHRAHRLMALLAAALILACGAMALRGPGPWRFTGAALVVLAVAEFAVGALAVVNELPIALAVAHNWLAGLLLLGLLRLLALRAAKPPLP